MSEPTTPPTPAPMPPASGSPHPRKSTWAYTLALVAVLVAGAAGYYYYEKSRNPEPPPPDELKGMKEYFARLASAQKLADAYTDADKDMVADTPKDAAKLLKIGDELTFTAVGTDDPAKAAEEWKLLFAALEKSTGKKVKYLDEVRTVEDQLTAVREGKLHITAFNTGAVPTAVSTAGFVPMFAPADASGKFSYEMEILVRKDDSAATPTDLKGRKIGFVALSSNSGAKAPILILKEEFQMSPGRDYKFGFTGDHNRSVKELVAGNYDAVCVANDLLRRWEAVPADDPKKVDPSKYKKIYTSRPFPPLCFGVPHNMPPEMQEKVKAAFTAFKFDASTPAGKRWVDQGMVGFAVVNYKKDWEFVRDIDDKLTRLFDRE